jgi:hypothetical protein
LQGVVEVVVVLEAVEVQEGIVERSGNVWGRRFSRIFPDAC